MSKSTPITGPDGKAPKIGTVRAEMIALAARPNGVTVKQLLKKYADRNWNPRHVSEAIRLINRLYGIRLVKGTDGVVRYVKPDAK